MRFSTSRSFGRESWIFSVETCHVLVNLFPCSRCQTFSTGFSEMSVWLCRSKPKILFSDRLSASSISLLFGKYSYPTHIQWNRISQLAVKVCDAEKVKSMEVLAVTRDLSISSGEFSADIWRQNYRIWEIQRVTVWSRFNPYRTNVENRVSS